MTTYITADTHLGHHNVLDFDPRPFKTIHEHDETIIKRWNKVVRPKDRVFHLGDVFLCNKDLGERYIQRLNGNITLIIGNHDRKGAVRLQSKIKCFAEIHEYYELKDGGNTFCLFHYPIHEWNKCHYGSYMLHGHTHGNDNYDESYRILNVGANLHDYYPLSLDEIRKKLKDRKIRSHH